MSIVTTLFWGLACSPEASIPFSENPHMDTANEIVEEKEPAVVWDYPYFMSFHTCDSSTSMMCGDPRNHTVYVAGSYDGWDWEILEDVPSFSSSVPDIVFRDDILYVVALPQLRRLNLRTGEWLQETEAMVLDQNDARMLHVDPSLGIDDENRLVMFFMEGIEGQNPATCPYGMSTCTKEFLTATEVVDSYGTTFVLDDGVRFSVTLTQPQSVAADPDYFYGRDGHIVYLSRGQKTQVFTSSELRGSYTALGDQLTNQGGVPAGFYHAQEDRYYTYVTKYEGEHTRIQLAVHDALETELREEDFTVVISGEVFFSDTHNVASPGIWVR